MKSVGSLYAGIGGLDIACEWALDAETVWQLDKVGEKVRGRHWPGVAQIVADVADVDFTELTPVDILAAGFSCQDLSTAGTRTGFDGDKTGPTYRGMLRAVDVLSPELVILENVPRLLSKHKDRLEADFAARGYGLVWVKVRALDVGTPHLRRRIFVIAEKGRGNGEILDAVRDGVWTGVGDMTWPTPTARDHRSAGNLKHTKGGRTLNDDAAMRPWPTATAGDAKASGSRCLDSDAHAGTSLTDAIRPDRTVAGDRSRPWATATATNPNEGEGLESFAARSAALVERGSRPLSEPLGQQIRGPVGRRLNPSWVETLQGFPAGWTETTGPSLTADPSPAWPRGRYPAHWDRSIPWPGFEHEPSRTLPDGPPVKGRPARLRAIGNAVCPQQGALALRTWQDQRKRQLP